MATTTKKKTATKRKKPQFGITLRKGRTTLGLTQRQMAKRIGVKASHVAYLENGRRSPSLKLLLKIAKEIKAKPSALALQAVPILSEFGLK